ncbi:MAG: tetratricopeptide repeat protein [Phycisphaera sp.]|nr:tetratricopeptide repeat protein [Phycisphaera sp.]
MTLAAALLIGLCCAAPLRAQNADTPDTDPAAVDTPDQPAAADTPARARGAAITPPELLKPDDVLPLAGDDLKKASLPLNEALKQVKKPAFLEGVDLPDIDKLDNADVEADAPEARPKNAADAAKVEADKREPPAEAIKAYIRGRDAYLNNSRWEAARQLEQAARLDPQSPKILRMLGTVYFDMGNHVRGAQRLQEAVKLDPDDSQSLFLLGRFAYQKGRWDEALMTLAYSARADQDSIDPVERHLRIYYMGQSLMRLGYDAAAADLLEKYTKMPDQIVRSTMLHRELAFLNRQRDRVYLQIGDALMRLGRAVEAVKYYSVAVPGVMTEPQDVLARKVYALLVLKQNILAERSLVEELRRGQQSSKMLELVPYLAGKTDDRQRFVDLLRSVYQQNERPAGLAMAIAELLDEGEAEKFLIDHLANSPRDMVAYQDLLSRLADRDMTRLVSTVVKMIQLRPEAANEYLEALAKLRLRVDDVLAALDKIPADVRDTAAAWHMRGFALQSGNRAAQAAAAYDKAMEKDPAFLASHIAAVDLQVRLRRFDKALELLDAIAKERQNDPKMRFARARVYIGLGRNDDAIAIINDLLAQQPRSVEYRLFKAQIEIAQQDVASAERTLLSILDFDPTNEDAYTALFNLYENNPRTDSTQWLRLLKRARDEVPASRISRMKMAEWYDANRQYDRAESLLKELLDEDNADYEALIKLVNVYKRANQWENAETLLLDLMDKNPDDPTPLQLFAEIAQRQGRLEQFFARMEDHLKRKDPSFATLERLAQLYSQWDKNVPAVDTLERAFKDFPKDATDLRGDVQRVRGAVMIYLRGSEPDRAIKLIDLAVSEHADEAPDLYYLKALVYHEKKEPKNAEQALLSVLKVDPNHAAANNDLGYLWADEGRNLDKALEMVTIAVTAEQENAAYLDSMGWVLYKLGRYDEAVRRLEEARTKPRGTDAVILEHLGDALWRSGKKDEAKTQWQAAMTQARSEASPDNADVRDRLEQKITAVTNSGEPEVAPVGPAGAPKPPDPQQ